MAGPESALPGHSTLSRIKAYARHIIGSYSRVEPMAPGMHRIAFQTLSEAALDPAESRTLIQTAESYWSATWRRASA